MHAPLQGFRCLCCDCNKDKPSAEETNQSCRVSASEQPHYLLTAAAAADAAAAAAAAATAAVGGPVNGPTSSQLLEEGNEGEEGKKERHFCLVTKVNNLTPSPELPRATAVLLCLCAPLLLCYCSALLLWLCGCLNTGVNCVT